MNIEFVVNDYLLAWYLLFKPAFSSDVQKLKERLWKNHQKLYMKSQSENIEILKYNKDFIPDDDTLYSLIFETEIFKKIKKSAEKHKRLLLEIWDKNKKDIIKNLNVITRIKNMDNFTVLVISPELDVIEYIKSNPNKNLAWGKREDKNDLLKALMNIIFTCFKYEFTNLQVENKDIVNTILDLAITNELHTKLKGISTYEDGYKKLEFLRRQLYPYWLMYLGCDKEGFIKYMMRDKIAFDIDKYQVERQLKNIDICGFIDFCCKNQKYIIKLEEIEII